MPVFSHASALVEYAAAILPIRSAAVTSQPNFFPHHINVWL